MGKLIYGDLLQLALQTMARSLILLSFLLLIVKKLQGLMAQQMMKSAIIVFLQLPASKAQPFGAYMM